jgi:Rad3-related DNA helicase
MMYPVSGTEIDFPVKPYGVQLIFMDRLIKALDQRENALLEAPTGCGKTLSLLCGALAWHNKVKRAQGFDEEAEEIALKNIRLNPGRLVNRPIV